MTELKQLTQRNWDANLLITFYTHPYRPIGKLIWELHQKFEFDNEHFASLKRVPNKYIHYRCTVMRFVCGYLPKGFSSHLLEHSIADVPSILKLLNDKIDTRVKAVDSDQTKEDSSIRQETKKEDMRIRVDTVLRTDRVLNPIKHRRFSGQTRNKRPIGG